MKKLSIGLRLTLWYLAIFAFAQIVFGAGMWFILRHNLYDIADDNLESQVEDLKNFLQSLPKGSSIPALQQAMAGTFALEHSGDYLEVLNGDQQLIYRSEFLQPQSVPGARINTDRFTYTDHFLGGKPLRFVRAKIDANGQTYFITTGVRVDDIHETLSLFGLYLLLFAPLLLALAAAGGNWLSKRALAPVDAIVLTAREVSGTNWRSRLQKLDTGDELQRLSDTLNEMLDRLESAFSRVTQFTADASHELRTPISLIRTEAELTLRRSRREEDYRESLRHILLEAERTTVLIEELLNLARADSGRESLTMHPVDLGEALCETAENWKQIATIRDLQFRARLDSQNISVMADRAALRRVVDILLDNAFKYTSVAGTVELMLEQKDDKAVIIVQDSGIGIPLEEQPRIFERFYRVDKARSREFGGAGLGLSIAHWIVQQHRGAIRVESGPGKGSVFSVELPLISKSLQDTVMAGTISPSS